MSVYTGVRRFAAVRGSSLCCGKLFHRPAARNPCSRMHRAFVHVLVAARRPIPAAFGNGTLLPQWGRTVFMIIYRQDCRLNLFERQIDPVPGKKTGGIGRTIDIAGLERHLHAFDLPGMRGEENIRSNRPAAHGAARFRPVLVDNDDLIEIGFFLLRKNTGNAKRGTDPGNTVSARCADKFPDPALSVALHVDHLDIGAGYAGRACFLGSEEDSFTEIDRKGRRSTGQHKAPGDNQSDFPGQPKFSKLGPQASRSII